MHTFCVVISNVQKFEFFWETVIENLAITTLNNQIILMSQPNKKSVNKFTFTKSM